MKSADPLAGVARRLWRRTVAGAQGQSRVADCIVVPDADQTPEMLAGLAPGIPAESQFARRLAESGCRVIVPVLIDRDDTYSIGADAARRPRTCPHREFIYRQAYEMGRHIIGYEVQKILALVDWLDGQRSGTRSQDRHLRLWRRRADGALCRRTRSAHRRHGA